MRLRLWRGVSIRARIAALQTLVVLAVLLMAGEAALLISMTDWHARRVRLARLQFAATAEVTGNAHRYSEQLGELLLLGSAQLQELHDARADLERGFAELERVTAAGVEFFAAGGEDLEQELREQRRLEVVWRLYRQVDRAAERVLALRSEGRQEQAVALFRDEIEERLDAELDRLLAEALTEVRSEVAKAETNAAWRRQQMAWTTGLEIGRASCRERV